MNITLLTDNPGSWFIPYGNELKLELKNIGHDVCYVFDKNQIREGDVCFLLSCSRLVQEEFLSRNLNNIVVHASDLPEGKGFSPFQWQILEGKNIIVLTLFEAVKDVDAGPYYFKDSIQFKGYELYEEMRQILAKKIIEMCLYFVKHRDSLQPITQTGAESFYKKRTVKDDEIDPDKTIADQFNHFRIADNDSFPLWFQHMGKKYFIKVYKHEENC